ncbi:hypothetical protein ACVMB0_005961 [Bradyrhizobium sp. USDA 4451]
MLRSAGDRDHRADNRGRARVAGDFLDEAAVDLDLVEREPLQILQRRVAGAEIVERDVDAERTELAERDQRGIVIGDQHRLGDLEFQPARVEPALGERIGNLQRQRLRPELDRRDVDRKPYMRRPGRRLDAGGAQHPLPDLLDQSGLLGDRYEIRRRDHAAHRMAPAQQRLAAGHFVAAQVDQRLVMQFEAALGQRGPQIGLKRTAQIGLLLHRRIEEAIGPAAGGLGRVHRKVGAFQQAEQVGAVARGDRDADTGIARQPMAEAVERRAQRLIDARHEVADVVVRGDVVLDDRELVAAEPRDEVVRSDRLPQLLGHAAQEFVADRMAERVVDPLELVDIDIVDREFAHPGLPQQLFRVALEQRPVRQIGQRIVMREIFDPRLRTPPIGDVLERGGPAAVRCALVDQADAAAVGRHDQGVPDLVTPGIGEAGAVGVDIADERAERLAMQDQVAQMASGFDDVGRQAEHVDILLVADHEPRRSVEQQQPLRHGVDCGVEVLALLGQPALRRIVLPLQLTHDQEHHHDHDQHRQHRGTELQLGLGAPVLQRAGGLRGGEDQDRKVRQRADRADILLAGGADEPPGRVAAEADDLAEQRLVGDVAADHARILRIARDDGAIAMDHRDHGVAVQRQRGHEILEMAGLDAAARKADDLAVAPGDLAGKDRGPVARHLAHRGLDDHGRCRPSRREFLEVAPVSDADVGHRPHLGRVDQPSLGVEEIEPADMRQRC